MFGHRQLLTFGVFAMACAFGPQAFAQCSTGAWDGGVTGSAQAIGAPSGKKYEGDCGLTVDGSSLPGYVTTTTPANEILFSARFYFYPEDLELTSGVARIFEALDGSTVQVRLSVKETAGALYLKASYRSGDTLVTYAEDLPLRGTWQGVTLSWAAGAGTGTFALKLDGVQQFAVAGLDNGDEVVNEVRLGVTNSPTATGKLVFDAFEMRRTAEEPPLLAVNELFNISTRAAVGNGDYAVIAGFIIDGDTPKCVIVRGRGPSVDVGNLARLEDPTMTLKSGATTVYENDNWEDDASANIVAALGKEPGDDSEAAFYTCLDPGAYTALLRGTAGTGRGIGIVEVIDVDEGTPYLFNISTRAEVITGARRVVAGFIIQGEQAKQVLIRGRGPTVNVGKPLLLDPYIELRDGPTVLASNDDWGNAANAADISATGKAPENAKEAAILITLQPDAYTVYLSSATDDPGIGIIEVLDIDGGSIESN